MTKAKYTAAQRRQRRAFRSQQKSIERIQNMIGDLRRQGFEFSKTFLKSLKVTGTTASDAAKKAARLKGITSKTKLLQRATTYTTDEGKILRGRKGVKEGIRQERKKRRKKSGGFSALDNLADAISAMTDTTWYSENRVTHAVSHTDVDVSAIKRKVISAYDEYQQKIRTDPSKYNLEEIGQLTTLAGSLQEESQSDVQYDNSAQKMIQIMSGQPVSPDDIGADEEMEYIS